MFNNSFGTNNSFVPNFFIQRPIDPQKFDQGVQNLNQERLDWLVQTARYSGINEQDIQTGLEYIKKIKDPNKGSGG